MHITARLSHAWIFMKKRQHYVLGFLVALAFMFGFLYGKKIQKESLESFRTESEFRQKGNYSFINPLLECEIFDSGKFLKTKNLESKVHNLADEFFNKSMVSYLSVYFRDLNNGPWIGFNENEKFTPASLLKVPIMIAVLKKEEQERGFLNKKITFKAPRSSNGVVQNIKPVNGLVDGKEYTMEELLEYMIEDSDNNASNTILQNMDVSYLNKVYSDLMIPIPGEGNTGEDFMTVKEYASFFRILYNASYLEQEMSEKALQILSKSNFEKGLVSGVPNGTVVAHKFGERVFQGEKQLHDCGVIYNENRTYLLCVMTRGADFQTMGNVIARVSKTVWDEVNTDR